MADVVHFKLERMLPELDDLERRGFFSRQEIAQIVKKRRKFEYRLNGHRTEKEDFLAYIDYEKQLDALRILRKKALTKSGDKKAKTPVSDYSFVSRIIEIYRLATTRFKGDIQLWFQYLEFCRARGHGRMRKVLAQLVSYHPKVPGAWIYAAAWEFDSNLNAEAARVLMQNGLRACPTSEDLWVEYLRMELTYFNKLTARKVALGEAEGLLSLDHRNADEKQWRDENQELFMTLNESEDVNKRTNLRDDETEGKLDVFRKQTIDILEALYSSAIEALPTTFSLRTRIFEILDGIELSHSEDLRTKILDDMRRDFSKEPSYWDWLARVEIAGLKGINPKQFGKAVQVYEDGLKSVPSSTFVELYMKFLMDAVTDENREGEAGTHFLCHGQPVELVSHVQTVFEKAENLGCMTEDLACQYVSFLLHLGKLDEANILIEKLCSEKFPDSVHLWSLRVSMEMNKSVSPRKADLQHILDLLRNILTKVGVSDAENLWILGLKYFTSQRHYFDKLVETSFELLIRDGGSDEGFSLSSTILNIILQNDGVESARQIYKRFLALPRPGLCLYRNCIELESNLASTGDKTGLPNARKLYDSALATYDQDATLWQDYHSMELKMGTSETAAAVQWRARKAIKNILLPTSS